VNYAFDLSKIQQGGYVIMLRWWQVLLLIAFLGAAVWLLIRISSRKHS
jgi:hypothetical protein